MTNNLEKNKLELLHIIIHICKLYIALMACLSVLSQYNNLIDHLQNRGKEMEYKRMVTKLNNVLRKVILQKHFLVGNFVWRLLFYL